MRAVAHPVLGRANSIIRLRVTSHSIARAVQVQGRLRRSTFRSDLAKLPGHGLLRSHLRVTLDHTHHRDSCQFTILFLSISQFGMIGSDLNRLVNSRLLVRVTDHLQNIAHATSLTTHLNKSRFVILLRSMSSLTGIVDLARSILTALHRPLRLDDRRIFTAIDINVIVNSNACRSSTRLLHSTSVTVCQTGSGKHSNCRIFGDTVRRRTVIQVRVRARLQQSLLRRPRRFVLCCRPVMSMPSTSIINFRTLIQ